MSREVTSWSLKVLFVLFLSFSRLRSEENDTITHSTFQGDSAEVYTKIHKCSCPSNEALVEGICQFRNTTILGVVEEYSSATSIISTNDISNVVIEPLVCPPNHLSLVLPGDSFAIETSGKLFNLNYGLRLEFSMYCVEHKVDEEGKLYLEIEICVPIPLAPKCCSYDDFDEFTRECKGVNNTEIEINFILGKKFFQMSTNSFYNVLKCHGTENVTHVSISPESELSHLKLTNEGFILSHQTSLTGERVNIPSSEYCVVADEDTNVASFASYCYVDPLNSHFKACGDSACVRKCCGAGEGFDMGNFRCTPFVEDYQFKPKFYNPKTFIKLENPQEFKMVYGLPLNCDFFPSEKKETLKLLPNGSLYFQNWHITIPSYQYCIDNFKYGNQVNEQALICFLESPPEKSVHCKDVRAKLYPSLFIISCVFLGITLAVYAIIPDLHCKVQGKCLISSIASLLSTYICLIIVQLSSEGLNEIGCTIFGILIQFTSLTSFFWLNVMSYDIWRTLRSMHTGKESPTGARRRFMLYSLYSWGCPSIISLVTLILQLHTPSPDENLILPRIGETSCFFPAYDKRVKWVYLYGFVSIILIINTFLFIHLAYILVKARKISEVALGKRNQLHKEWAKLYLKLFLIMGITWVFEVTSFITSDDSCAFWVVTDVINSLRGLLIFIAFVCKRDIIRKLLSESTPAFHRMRSTVRQSSLLFSRSSKRTSNVFIDPSSASATHEVTNANNHDTGL